MSQGVVWSRLVSHSHNGSFNCVQDVSSASICLLIQMSYGNVETILGANLAGREIVKTCLLVPVFKASLPISQSCPPPHPPTSHLPPGSILIGGWLGTSPLCLPHVNRHKRSDYLYPQLLHTQMIIKNNEAKQPKWFSMGESLGYDQYFVDFSANYISQWEEFMT